MSFLTDVKTFFVKVEAGAEAAFDDVKGVIDRFESTATGSFVAQVLENTAIGTKVENLLQDAKTEAMPLIDMIKHIAEEIEADVAQVEGLIGDAKTAAVAVASTAISDLKAVKAGV